MKMRFRFNNFKGGVQGYFFLENDFRDIDFTWRIYQGQLLGKIWARNPYAAPVALGDTKVAQKLNFCSKVVEL